MYQNVSSFHGKQSPPEEEHHVHLRLNYLENPPWLRIVLFLEFLCYQSLCQHWWLAEFCLEYLTCFNASKNKEKQTKRKKNMKRLFISLYLWVYVVCIMIVSEQRKLTFASFKLTSRSKYGNQTPSKKQQKYDTKTTSSSNTPLWIPVHWMLLNDRWYHFI